MVQIGPKQAATLKKYTAVLDWKFQGLCWFPSFSLHSIYVFGHQISIICIDQTLTFHMGPVPFSLLEAT
jgi:hypothetical protein